jgi:2',3'-cyclic-nucleotide 2'-phosphodiesterase (5'-nucleotidase family)
MGADIAMARVIVFHTSDFHNRLYPAAARQLAELKRANPGALLFDSGDALRAGNLGFSPRGEPILRQMAETGYDAMAMGNRESHPNRLALARKLRDATFPILSANMRAKDGHLPPHVQPHVFFECGGVRLAVFGLARQITRPNSIWAAVTDFVWEEPVMTALHAARELRSRADLVICLSHCGHKTDRVLSEIPEVDLVLGGHSHQDFIERVPGRALMVEPGKFASHVSHTGIISRDDVWSELIPLEVGP